MLEQQQSLCSNNQVEKEKFGTSAPVWIPDEHVTMCQSCSIDFTVFRRRHHCRGCGIVACSSCLADSVPLIYLGLKKEKVCPSCSEIYAAELIAEFSCITENVPVDGTDVILPATRILDAMKAHPGNPNVNYQACCALTQLAANNAVNQAAIAAAGGVKAVIQAMKAHPNHEGVNQCGCDALSYIARANGELQRAVNAAGGNAVAQAAITNHPNVAAVVASAKQLMSLLK